MNQIINEILGIKRPRSLMNAAKVHVIENKVQTSPLSTQELRDLIEIEEKCEQARKGKQWHYSAEAHIIVLAQMIDQARCLLKKGIIN